MNRARPARAADAVGIATVHIAAWRETYAHILAPELLAGLSIPDRTARWERILADADPEHVVFVAGAEAGAGANAEIVGFAAAGRCRDSDPPRDYELYSIYLLATHHGSGLAQALLDAALGSRPASLWVAEDNPRAQAFYRRNGFTADGSRRVVTYGEGIAEIRMLR